MKLITKISVTNASVYTSNGKFFVLYYNRVVYTDSSQQACIGIALNKVLIEKILSRLQKVWIVEESALTTQ